MDRRFAQLRQEKDAAFQKARTSIDIRTSQLEDHLAQIQDEYSRVVQLSGQAGYILDNIDREFKEKTKLAAKDIVLLFLCTALQCARQYLLTGNSFRITSTQGDKLMEDTFGNVKPEWKDVLFQSVPYDAIKTGAHISDTELSGTTHRYRTLGHDPVLGWIFGTANIMTNSLTKYNFETYQVSNNMIIRHYPSGVAGMLGRAVVYTKEEPKLLAASVARQAIHFGSDMFTKQGLPVPFIMTVNNDLAKDMLSKWHIDSWAILRSSGLAALINQLIFCIHSLFYNEDKDGPRSMYEVRTRKILSFSNALATGSNVLVTVLTRDVSKLDVGGMLVTLYRLVSDYKFIHEVKRDFLQQEFHKMVVGEKYNFMEEDDYV